jgi:hypothetical protein
VVLLCVLIVIVMWSDFVEASGYLRRLPDRIEVRRTARQACENLDTEYERLLNSYR